MLGWTGMWMLASTVGIIVLPGWVVARVAGRRGADALIWATPITFLITTAVAFGQAVVDYPFSWVMVLVGHVIVAVGLVVVRRVRAARSRTTPRAPALATGSTPSRTRASVLHDGSATATSAAIGVLAATSLTAWAVYRNALGHTLETASQSWDGLFDINAVRSIMSGGPADPFHANGFLSTDPATYYPTAFHSVAASLGELQRVDAVVAANLCSIVIAGLLWPSACLILLRALFGRRPMVIVAGATTVLGFWGMPWGPFGFGVLYATGTAAAFAPLAVAGAARLLGQTLADPGPRRRAMALLALGLGGVGAAHPRVLVLLACLLGPMWVVALLTEGAGGIRQRDRVRVRRAVGGAVATVLAIGAAYGALKLANGSALAGKLHVIFWPHTESLQRALYNDLTNQPADTVRQVVTGVLVVLGGLLALRRRELWWLPATYLFLVALHALTATSNNYLVDHITRYWYADQYRIGAMPPVAAVPLAAFPLIVLAVGDHRTHHPSNPRLPQLAEAARHGKTAVALVTALALVSLVVGIRSPSQYLRSYYVGASLNATASLVSPEEVAFFERVHRLVPMGDVVLNNATDGSSLLYAYTGTRVAMYTGYNVSPTKYGRVLRDTLVTAPPHRHWAICRYLKQDKINWVINLGTTYSNDAISVQPAPGMQVPPRFWATTEVLHAGSASLYKVTGCNIPGA